MHIKLKHAHLKNGTGLEPILILVIGVSDRAEFERYMLSRKSDKMFFATIRESMVKRIGELIRGTSVCGVEGIVREIGGGIFMRIKIESITDDGFISCISVIK